MKMGMEKILLKIMMLQRFDTVPKTSLFEQAKLSKTSEAVKSLNMNKDSHLVLFEPRSFGETQDIANYLKTKKSNSC